MSAHISLARSFFSTAAAYDKEPAMARPVYIAFQTFILTLGQREKTKMKEVDAGSVLSGAELALVKTKLKLQIKSRRALVYVQCSRLG
jgi:hypothetical protein